MFGTRLERDGEGDTCVGGGGQSCVPCGGESDVPKPFLSSALCALRGWSFSLLIINAIYFYFTLLVKSRSPL